MPEQGLSLIHGMPLAPFQQAAEQVIRTLGLTSLTPAALALALEKRCGGNRESLARLNLEDLCIAQGALANDPIALEMLERDAINQARSSIARIDPAPAFVEDQLQLLRSRMLVGEDGRRRLDEFDGRGSLAGFLRASAIRLALNARRGGVTTVGDAALEDELANSNPEFETFVGQHAGQLAAAIRESLSSLPDRDRQLLRMAVLESMTTRQMGLALGVSHATAARWLQQAYATVLHETRRRLAVATGVSEASMDSFIGALQQHVQVSMSALLTPNR